MDMSMPTDLAMEFGDGESVMSGLPTESHVDVNSGDVMSETKASSSSTPSTSRSSYVPQFSSATSLILNRIKREFGLPGSPTSAAPASPLRLDDEPDGSARTKLARSMSETLSMPLPPGQQLSTAAASIDAASSYLGRKRKREQEDDGVDFTQSTILLPLPVPQPAPAPSLATPLKTTVKKCSKCEQHAWAPQNMLVSCNKCFRSWHQKCAWPVITDGKANEYRFLCTECANAKGNDGGMHEALGQRRQKEMEELREKNLSALPEGVVPAKAELVGFLGGQASDLARTEYFYGKKKTDLLNILSFCDQLKPQLLVDILVSVAKKHPALPIFDSPDWNTQTLGTAPAKLGHSHQTSRPVGRPRHGHVLDSKAKLNKHKASKRILKVTSIIEAEEVPLEENRDSLPPTWPKAGEGLYAKLPLEDGDRAFLLDENDEEAFSQFGVDKFGKQIAVPACA